VLGRKRHQPGGGVTVGPRVRKIASHLQTWLTLGEGRRQLTAEIKVSLRKLSNRLSPLNHHVGAHVDLKDVDLDHLDLISRDGPRQPKGSRLPRRAAPRHQDGHR
jgi:hypothetical protein